MNMNKILNTRHRIQMTSGPCVVMVLEKIHAVVECLNFLGPDTPEEWTKADTTLRGTFGQSSKAIGFRSSKWPWTVAAERAFFFSSTHESSKTHAGLSSGPARDKVSLECLLRFLFSPGKQHPRATGRLFVFALYGPLDGQSRLRSGERGQHVVSDLELNTMCLTLEREDILSVYTDEALTAEEEEELMIQADHYLKIIPQYQPCDIHAILANVVRDADGLLDFHEMQRVILAARQDRVKKMKKNILDRREEACVVRLKQHQVAVSKMKYETAPKSMFKKEAGLNGAQNAVLTSKLLSTRAFQICASEDCNSHDITQNVRLLRETFRDPAHRVAWKN